MLHRLRTAIVHRQISVACNKEIAAIDPASGDKALSTLRFTNGVDMIPAVVVPDLNRLVADNRNVPAIRRAFERTNGFLLGDSFKLEIVRCILDMNATDGNMPILVFSEQNRNNIGTGPGNALDTAAGRKTEERHASRFGDRAQLSEEQVSPTAVQKDQFGIRSYPEFVETAVKSDRNATDDFAPFYDILIQASNKQLRVVEPIYKSALDNKELIRVGPSYVLQVTTPDPTELLAEQTVLLKSLDGEEKNVPVATVDEASAIRGKPCGFSTSSPRDTFGNGKFRAIGGINEDKPGISRTLRAFNDHITPVG